MSNNTNNWNMDKVINISTLISTDIRSRANANIIRSVIDGIDDGIIFDFGDVTFVSRSFMDEIYNILEDHKGIRLTNMSEFVDTMFEAVKRGRQNKRDLPNSKSEIKVLKDMESLESFFATV